MKNTYPTDRISIHVRILMPNLCADFAYFQVHSRKFSAATPIIIWACLSSLPHLHTITNHTRCNCEHYSCPPRAPIPFARCVVIDDDRVYPTQIAKYLQTICVGHRMAFCRVQPPHFAPPCPCTGVTTFRIAYHAHCARTRINVPIR